MRIEIAAVAVLIIGVAVLSILPSESAYEKDSLKKFASYDELKDFVKKNSENYAGGYGLYGVDVRVMAASEDAAVAQAASSPKASEFSSTNVQVLGVDEADIVKNDGKYIYVVSGGKIVIVDAYPAENARILSEIEANGTPNNIFVNNDRLVVFGSEYNYYPYAQSGPQEKIMAMPYPYYGASSSYIRVYDIIDRSNPVLARNLSVDGYYFDSRMIGDYVYAVVNQPVYAYGEEIPVPIVRPLVAQEFPDIYYFDVPDNSYNFVNIIAVDVNGAAEPSVKTYMLPSSQNVYVSANSIYLSYTKWLDDSHFFGRFVDEVVTQLLPAEMKGDIDRIRNSDASSYDKSARMMKLISNYSESLGPEGRAAFGKDAQEKMAAFQAGIAKERESTVIHKLSITGGGVEYVAQGSVPGHALNQFSMDEHGGYFRIATTTSGFASGPIIMIASDGSTVTNEDRPAGMAIAPPVPAASENNLYVLDSGMNIAGRLEGLAEGERIYSARFVGDRAYMVTFRQIDPLFVIDLSEPAAPKILGFLKVAGVSDYLHPVDENHVIGIGKEATEEGRFLGLKMSLFDVSDAANPIEVSKVAIGDRGTDSYALQDHKAFLFDKEKRLLVLPVLLAETDGAGQDEWAYGTYKFQGAYVFDFSVETGFTLRGTITHARGNETDYESYWGPNSVKRSLYMDDVLYTVSDRMIRMNSIGDLSDISSVELPFAQDYYALKGTSVAAAE